MLEEVEEETSMVAHHNAPAAEEEHQELLQQMHTIMQMVQHQVETEYKTLIKPDLIFIMPEAAVVLIKIMQLLDSAVKVDKVVVEEELTTAIKVEELEQTVLAEAVEVETLLHTMAEME